ncbi:MAG: glycosyltransferase [Deltaproteobacteria bacterium]
MDARLRGVREEQENSGVRVLVVGDPAALERDLADQVAKACGVTSASECGLEALVVATAEEFVLVASASARWAPAALAAAVAALQARPTAAAAVLACEFAEGGEAAAADAAVVHADVAALLLAAAAGKGPLPEQLLFRRTALADAFGPRGGRTFGTAALAVLARHEVVFLAEGLVRSLSSGSRLLMGEEFLDSALLEDFCFRLGGGAWASPAARLQARARIEAALARRASDLRIPPISDVSATRRGALPLAAVAPIPGGDFAAVPVPSAAELCAARAARRLALKQYEQAARPGTDARQAAADPPLASATIDPASSKPLRVALMVSRLDRGGLESVVRDLAIGFPAQGCVPFLICEKGGGRVAESLRAAGVAVFCLGENDPVGELAVLLDDLEIDVLATHDAWSGVPVAVARDIPVVAVLHNEYGWLGAGKDDPMAALGPLISGYIAVSESVRAFHAARFGVMAASIAVVRNAPSPRVGQDARLPRAQARAELALDDGDTILLSIGRIEPVKNQILLVEAFARRQAAGLRGRLLLVGEVADSLYAARLHARIAALGLGPVVQILGVRGDIARLLSAADLFVLPSLFEGLSLAAAEALQAGVPAVLGPTGDADFLLGLEDGAAPAGIRIERPAADPHRADLGALLGRAACPDEDEIRALDDALAGALAGLPGLKLAAVARAGVLAEMLDPMRPIREHAARLLAAAAMHAPSHLPAAQAARLAARAGSSGGRGGGGTDGGGTDRPDALGLSRRLKKRVGRLWRRLRPA